MLTTHNFSIAGAQASSLTMENYKEKNLKYVIMYK